MRQTVHLHLRQSEWCASLTLVSGNPMHVTPRQTMMTSKLSVLMKAAYPLSISSPCVALFIAHEALQGVFGLSRDSRSL